MVSVELTTQYVLGTGSASTVAASADSVMQEEIFMFVRGKAKLSERRSAQREGA